MIYVSVPFKEKPGRDAQVETLLDALRTADDNAFNQFCDALTKNEQAWIVDTYLQSGK